MSNQFFPIDLPSESRIYNTSQIEVRAFTVEEVKRLQPLLKRNDINKMFSLIGDCVKGIDVRDLTTGDWWYVLAYLRLNTFPHIPLMRQWVCPKDDCHALNNMRVSLAALQVVGLPPEFREPAYINLDSGVEVPLRLRRVGYAIKAEEYLQTLHSRAPKEEEIEEVELAMTIVTSDTYNNLDSKLKLIRSLDPEDYLLLSEFQDVYSHGIPNLVTDTCKECGCENTRVRMYFHPSELIPSGGSRDRVRNAVHFREPPAQPGPD